MTEPEWMHDQLDETIEGMRRLAAEWSAEKASKPVTVSATCAFCKCEQVLEVSGNRFDGLLKQGWGSSLDGIVVCPDCLKGW